jgi:hypothetical protein
VGILQAKEMIFVADQLIDTSPWMCMISVYGLYTLEDVMELYRARILLEKSQHETLTQIAQEESRSLSEIVREMIDRELRFRLRRQMMLAARELQADYSINPDLSEFDVLDGDDFLFQDDENEKG